MCNFLQVYLPKVYIFRHGKNISSNGIRISSYFAAGYRTAFCHLNEDCQEWKNSPTKNVIIYIILPFQNLSIDVFQSKYQHHQSIVLIYHIKKLKLISNFVFWKFLIFESLKLNFLFLHPIIYNPSMQLFPYKRKMH